jgi:hypothetical protein
MIIRISFVALLALAVLAGPAARAAEGDSSAPQPSGSASGGEGTATGKDGASAGKDKEAASKEEVRTLAEELRRLKLEIGLRDVEYQSYAGMGPAASKVYFAPKGLSIGGYGEINYQNGLGNVSNDQTDLLRLVLYAGYRFNDRIVFNSEVEFEHAGKEVSVEFAYLDFLLTRAVRLRIGNFLMPIGFINEMHEPPFFNGVFRPDVERLIIPTTWSENGIGLHGEVGGLRYQAYAVNGLDVLRDPATLGEDKVETSSWLANSKSGSAEARAATFGGIVNLEYAAGPVTVGGTFYGGRADQRRLPDVKATVTITEAHAQLAWKGATARVLGVVGTLGDAAAVNAFLTSAGGVPVNLGSRVQGGYGEVAYDVLSLVTPGGESSLSPFVRLEGYDLNAKVPSGFTRDPSVDILALTTGLTYRPIPTVVVKADYQRRDPRAGALAEQVNFGAGFAF